MMNIRTVLAALLVGSVVALAAGDPEGTLRFEVEKWTTPKDAWLVDKHTDTKWNLWSTDSDAKKKWSGGIVLQSPRVMADRKSGEEGAPVLHTVLTGIPKGAYNIEIKSGRVLGVSLDGKTWSRYTGGLVVRRAQIDDGKFELWVDDRYAMENEKSRGSTYYDYILLHPCAPIVKGVPNGDFEFGAKGAPLGWIYHSREKTGSACVEQKDEHAGRSAVHVTFDGERDWTLICSESLPVRPGDELAVSAWGKGTVANTCSVQLSGYHEGKRIRRAVGRAGMRGGKDWTQAKGHFTVPADVTELRLYVGGTGPVDIRLDDIALTHEAMAWPNAPKVKGWASKRAEEKLDRGVVAMRTPEGVYIGWRLLKDDPADIAFDVFRRIEGGPEVKGNSAPIRETTDFLDTSAPADAAPVYTVRPVGQEQGLLDKLFGQRPRSPEGSAKTAVCEGPAPYVSVKLDGDHKFQKIGLADLDGDTHLDYVIKQPGKNIDPAGSYWYRSPDTYKIEAYLNDGTFLWRHDLGWGIERGIWYSPYVVFDLTGDGKAEVAAKVGEGDPRNEEKEGRVTSGPEWMVVWDGMTGKEIARVPWPDRFGFGSYSRMARNQMAAGYLDGKTPCLLALRGTYDRMKVDAYQLRDGKLDLLWRYDNDCLPGEYWGQGAHFTRVLDVDNDGRDEVMLGSAILDDNGIPLWTLGMGHNDHAYVGDIDPHRPGLEIYYGFETRAQKNGMCLADAATGKIIWGFGEPTRHIHGTGMCADIDPTVPGLECFGLDCLSKKPDIRKGPWLWAADGKLLWFENPILPKTYSLDAIYWDADLQKEILRGGKVSDYAGGEVARIGGGPVLIADVIGDWREEVVASFPGEIRIYSTTIPATDRRVCLLQDRIYRADVTMDTMGYVKEPMTSYCLEAHWPGLNLTVMTGEDEKMTCRAVVTAPLGRAVNGRLKLECEGLRLEPGAFDVKVAPGERSVMTAALKSEADFGGERLILGTFSGKVHAATAPAKDGKLPTDPVGPMPTRAEHPVTLRARVPVRLAGKVLTGLPMAQAEDLASQGGGKVKIRTDKKGASGKAISHWDDKGHWLEWRIRLPEAGKYELLVRYCTPKTAQRKVAVDGRDCGSHPFAASGGFGSASTDWNHALLRQGGAPLRLTLDAGEHTIRLENTDGQGLNLDYLVLRKVK